MTNAADTAGEAVMPGASAGLIRRFRYTLSALTLACLVLFAAMFWSINVFGLPGINIIGIEESEIGEVAIAFLLVVPAFFVDRVVTRQRMYEVRLQAEQLRVLRVTMRTVQDIVNNNLNRLQLLRFEADGHVSAETLTLFDDSIRDTAGQLTKLGNMSVFAEKSLATGPGLDITVSTAPH